MSTNVFIIRPPICKDAALLSDNGNNIQFEPHFVETESNNYSFNGCFRRKQAGELVIQTDGFTPQ
ncbi:hypothetical protein RO3G_11642 [Rhizopus delemar RA 99-880]|uniref:Uncharacterized protein n=1 Tax=Rhizopus delemar (strain RA 99-880 / ATCC MYA-4621 / FGSC 9543 / NRRL 43880) TaxID=246409 RepID=I1CEQ1_RHIO9|nr:hypothetical protein RO3G_11642 [Rhizopus delemar RA 99-880]|eukprot:EIE86931.1 hypothetical protein RO3G_11642 [Rhizopus delemar RA 99-880]